MKNNKKILVIILLLILIISLFFIKKILTGTLQTLINLNESTLSPKQIKISEYLVYKNDKYNFEFNLPLRWEDYKVSENENSLIFSLKLKDPIFLDDGTREYGDLFIITAFSNETWIENQNADDPSVNNFLGKNDKYIFGILKGQDDEGFHGFPKYSLNEVYKGPFYDITNTIIPSFKAY